VSELKIIAGRYYRTRDGRKAFVAGRNPFCDSLDSHRAFVGAFETGQQEASWDERGRYIIHYESKEDLVAEWREPRKFKLWVYAGHHPDNVEAYMVKQITSTPLLAIVEVTEGDGLPANAP
jgi:hypothetical protein